MDDAAFDKALIAAAFGQAAQDGWRRVSVAEAARTAGLPLDRARERFPNAAAVLLRFGVLADRAALDPPATEPTGRERLFDMLMRRFDVLQAHRDGVLALLRGLPFDPGTSLLLYGATLRSMRWMLDAAEVPTAGLRGAARVHGLLAVWLYALRAWEADDSADLSGTMAAMDRALDRAVQAEGWIGGTPDGGTHSAAAVFGQAGLPPDPATDPTEGFAAPADLDTAIQPPPPAADTSGSPAV